MLAGAVNDATPSSALPAATLAQYKEEIATARAEVTEAVEAVAGAESGLTNAQNQLVLAQAGSTPQSIQAQNAVVLQAQAGLSSAEVALQQATLVAPFSGVVTNLTAQIGQVVSPGSPLLTLTNNSGLKIDAYVSETDIANVRGGDRANVTLDAYGSGTIFPATVSTIDTTQTMVNGTPAYLVTLHFSKSNTQVTDGMTGNAQIITAEHDNVVEVPSNLIIQNGSSSFVLVASGTAQQEVPVMVGISGNGMTEITSGVSAGQQIASF